uniref:Uncharacterized protein n=1 Tax=Glossina pallidipes TaxID=7398 RepID=A0A1B0AHD2_GLOPL
MVKSSWLYSLRKEELSEICGTLDLDTKGTVEEMRKAVAALITNPDLAADMKMKLTELETRYAANQKAQDEVQVLGDARKNKCRAARLWTEFANGQYATTAKVALLSSSGESRSCVKSRENYFLNYNNTAYKLIVASMENVGNARGIMGVTFPEGDEEHHGNVRSQNIN